MSRKIELTRSLALLLTFVPAWIDGSYSSAAERPTLNHTCDPRPDILPHPFYYAHSEYRRAYNRPRYWSGWIADKISLTSQEAMVWQENVAAGRYDGKDCPPMYKSYRYPKPWEVLQTGPRPDFAKPAKKVESSQATENADEKNEVDEEEDEAGAKTDKSPVPMPVEGAAAEDEPLGN